MTNELIAIYGEPMPSLPPSLDGLLREVADQSRTGSRQATITRHMTRDERSAAQARLRAIERQMAVPRGGREAMAEIARMLAGFSVTSTLSQSQADAKATVYEDAIGDLPAWAIVAARRAWARGETDGLKGKIDPSFPPAPAHVRWLAQQAMARPAIEATRLRMLLGASVTAPMPIEHRREMLRRMSELLPSKKASTEGPNSALLHIDSECGGQ